MNSSLEYLLNNRLIRIPPRISGPGWDRINHRFNLLVRPRIARLATTLGQRLVWGVWNEEGS